MYQPMYGQGYPGGYLTGYPTAYGPLQYYPPLAAAAAYYPAAMQPAPVRPTIMVSVSSRFYNFIKKWIEKSNELSDLIYTIVI